MATGTDPRGADRRDDTRQRTSQTSRDVKREAAAVRPFVRRSDLRAVQLY